MKDFTKIHFKGTFRSYQQKVLNQMEYYLQDHKIHIVAAPGSGKTTLGIELIKRLNQPALILSPSITIRNQWGKRIRDGFLDDDENISDYVSSSLKDVKLFTSITYQGLHAAFHHLIDKDTTEDEIEEELYVVDYSNFDLLNEIKKNKIRTICLDEAHHLRSEWYKVLSKVLEQFQEVFTIIALTATPPYDSQGTEWENYISLCGEIDEEIFVPELIQQENLCPHQDYIYFNYPSASEREILREYREKGANAIQSCISNPLFVEWVQAFCHDYNNEKYNLFENVEEYNTLRLLVEKEDINFPRRLTRILQNSYQANTLKISKIEKLFNFMISSPLIFSVEMVKILNKTLRNHGVIEYGKVQLESNSSLKRTLISSIGKIASIGDIARFESQTLGHDLQMLVLTDYIKKEMIHLIGSNDDIHVFGAVPIFEVIRRNIDPDIHIALLTGSLIIIPKELEDVLSMEAAKHSLSFSTQPVGDTDYVIVKFQGTIKDSVYVMTELFEKRHIDILIGTKSLLGEGWDSPCINTLIMASFVGSYMLSNQMRGRAIRIDKNDPNKVASIWHLATVEPYHVLNEGFFKVNKIADEIEKNEIVSHDYDMLKRRFKTFLGPSYTSGIIQTGIERIDIIQPPFSAHSFQELNKKTFEFAENRKLVQEQWRDACAGEWNSEIIDTNEVPNDFWPAGLVLFDVSSVGLVSAISIRLISSSLQNSSNLTIPVIILAVAIILTFKGLKSIFYNLTPKRTIHSQATAIFKTCKKLALIQSHSATVYVKFDRLNLMYKAYLENATRHEKALFSSALQESLSKIENPRYIVIRSRSLFEKTFYQYSISYAVPSIFTSNQKTANEYQEYLSDYLGKMSLVYTRSEKGLVHLRKAKRNSKLNRLEIQVISQKVLKKNESNTKKKKRIE